MEKIGEILIQISHYIGSAMPLTILCFMIVFIIRGRKIKMKTVNSYAIVAAILFFILWRT